MSPTSKFIVVLIRTLALALLLSLVSLTSAIGHNGRIDMLQTVNHKEEIESLLNKRYTGDVAPREGGEIYRVKEVVENEDAAKGTAGSFKNTRNGGNTMSHKALYKAAKNGESVIPIGLRLKLFSLTLDLFSFYHLGFMASSDLQNVVTNILEASETVERQSMI
jgi:hypothetical protein